MSDDSRSSRRRYLAERILASYRGEADARDVFAEVGGEDYDDAVVGELLDLFEHQPVKSRWWGLTGPAYDAYVSRVRALAAAVAADPTAVPRVEDERG